MNPFTDPFRGQYTPTDDEPGTVRVLSAGDEPKFEDSLAQRIKAAKETTRGEETTPDVAASFMSLHSERNLSPAELRAGHIRDAAMRADAAYREIRAAVDLLRVVDQEDARRQDRLVRDVGELANRLEEKL